MGNIEDFAKKDAETPDIVLESVIHAILMVSMHMFWRLTSTFSGLE
jgi:hypothetical protein